MNKVRVIGWCGSASLFVLGACASPDPAALPDTMGAAGAASVTAGAGSITGGGASAAAGAGASGGSAGSVNVAGAAGAVSHAGAGGSDPGDLFGPGTSVPFDPNAGGGGGAGPIPGDGQTATSKLGDGTAVFTQTGADVTVVVKLSGCPNGEHSISIRDGYSCDSDALEKGVWDGQRGLIGDKGTITCSNNSGSMTYTRKGADPTLNWSIGSQLDSDLTPHVVVVTNSADPNGSHKWCGNFF